MEGLRYDQLHRLGARGWWRPVVGVAFLVVLVVASQSGLVLVLGLGLFIAGRSLDEVQDLLGGDPVTPIFLAAVNVGWAVAIPAVWLVTFLLHDMKPGWISSVRPRIRWGWLLTCFGLSILALFATLVVSALLPAQSEAVGMSGELNPWTDTMRDFVLVVVLLTPLQAAGEEYAFRGYLTQACGGLTRSRVVAVVVPALIFALAHGLGQDWPIFFDRFAFGLVAGTLVILTGGLEAGIAMHVLNNFLAFALALAFGDMTSALNPTGGTWWSIPVTLTQSLSYLALAVGAARLMSISTVTGPAVLERPDSRV